VAAIVFYSVYSIIWILTLLPLRVLYLISDILYPFVYYLFCYRKKVVKQNLKNAYPGKTENEIKKIEKGYYRHFCDITIEIIKLLHLSSKSLEKRIRYKNPEIIEELFRQKKHVIAVVGHYGNWEWLNSFALQTNYNIMAIYKPLNNKYFDRFFLKIRQQYGTVLVPMKKTLRALSKYRKQNLLTISCFISDQCPVREELDYWTTFLNQDTPVFLGIEKMAQKMNQAVVFFNMQKIRRGYYEGEFIKLTDEPRLTKPHEITEKHVRILEELINQKPEYWLWSHRRWKFKRSDMIEKNE
jgi:KDO2-lipid IV(A) lauroyltransferase